MARVYDDIGICLPTLLADPMVCSRDDFVAIAAAAATAGHRSVSVWPMHAAAIGWDDVVAILADHGLAVGAIEACTSWAGGDGDAVRAEADATIAAAERVGARVAGAVTLDATIDAGRAAEGLAALCRHLGEAHIAVAVEFLPWTGIPSLAVVWDLVQAAGEPNAGILLDTWHWQRQPGGPNLAQLRRIPGDRIPYVQVCDSARPSIAPASGDDLLAEAMSARQLPGEGIVDFDALGAALDAIGARPFVASEIFNTELVSLGPAGAARRMHAACATLR
jgi:sugar phosphate isomerase/epimerase